MGAPRKAVGVIIMLLADPHQHPRLNSISDNTLNCIFRSYPLKKIQENNEAEILQTVLDEARESYAEEIIVELKSDTVEEMESNVARIVQWIENWKKDQST